MNGQVERIKRILNNVMVHGCYYPTHMGLRERLDAFLDTYNFAKRQKTLWGLTAECIVKTWTAEPERFVTGLYHLTWDYTKK